MKIVLKKSKIDDLKIERMSVLFFLHSYLPFLALISHFFVSSIAWSDFKAFWSYKIKVHMAVLCKVLTRFP